MCMLASFENRWTAGRSGFWAISDEPDDHTAWRSWFKSQLDLSWCTLDSSHISNTCWTSVSMFVQYWLSFYADDQEYIPVSIIVFSYFILNVAPMFAFRYPLPVVTRWRWCDSSTYRWHFALFVSNKQSAIQYPHLKILLASQSPKLVRWQLAFGKTHISILATVAHLTFYY